MKHITIAALAALLVHGYTFSRIVHAPVSVGELIDKITILQIKSECITDPIKIKNVSYELTQLEETLKKNIPNLLELENLINQLKRTNQWLWEIEDCIREKESNKEFDHEFITLSRAVYFTNDKRCAIKRQINEVCGSTIIEEKSYRKYSK